MIYRDATAGFRYALPVATPLPLSKYKNRLGLMEMCASTHPEKNIRPRWFLVKKLRPAFYAVA
jgi:hypothetical protein